MPSSINPKLPACGQLIHGSSNSSLSTLAYLPSSWTCTPIPVERFSQALQQKSPRAKVRRVHVHLVSKIYLTNNPNRSTKTPSPHIRSSRQARLPGVLGRREHARRHQPEGLQSRRCTRRNGKCHRNSTVHPTLHTSATGIPI